MGLDQVVQLSVPPGVPLGPVGSGAGGGPPLLPHTPQGVAAGGYGGDSGLDCGKTPAPGGELSYNWQQEAGRGSSGIGQGPVEPVSEARRLVERHSEAALGPGGGGGSKQKRPHKLKQATLNEVASTPVGPAGRDTCAASGSGGAAPVRQEQQQLPPRQVMLLRLDQTMDPSREAPFSRSRRVAEEQAAASKQQRQQQLQQREPSKATLHGQSSMLAAAAPGGKGRWAQFTGRSAASAAAACHAPPRALQPTQPAAEAAGVWAVRPSPLRVLPRTVPQAVMPQEPARQPEQGQLQQDTSSNGSGSPFARFALGAAATAAAAATVPAPPLQQQPPRQVLLQDLGQALLPSREPPFNRDRRATAAQAAAVRVEKTNKAAATPLTPAAASCQLPVQGLSLALAAPHPQQEPQGRQPPAPVFKVPRLTFLSAVVRPPAAEEIATGTPEAGAVTPVPAAPAPAADCTSVFSFLD